METYLYKIEYDSGDYSGDYMDLYTLTIDNCWIIESCKKDNGEIINLKTSINVWKNTFNIEEAKHMTFLTEDEYLLEMI